MVQHSRLPGRNLHRGIGLASKTRREGEGAAPAHLAFHGDLSAHQGHELPADGQDAELILGLLDDLKFLANQALDAWADEQWEVFPETKS